MPTKQRYLQFAPIISSKEDAAKHLVMQYRIERAARYTMYVAILVFAASMVMSALAIIHPLRLPWRDR